MYVMVSLIDDIVLKKALRCIHQREVIVPRVIDNPMLTSLFSSSGR